MDPGSARTLLCPLDPTLVEGQSQNNRETADHWDLYADHRLRVNSLIEAQGPDDRLCVLGAGNANSFDLAALTSRFGEVHLCDVDSVALDRAVEKQAAANRSKLVLHAPIDLSGVLAHLPEWARTQADIDALRALPETVAAHLLRALPGPFEVVVSEGLLTQILFTCFKALGDTAILKRVLPFVLLAHLRVLATLTKPGGCCVLVTDAAFSEGLPPHEILSESDGLALLNELDQRGKLFTGTSPALLARALSEKGLTEHVGALRFVPPWRWQFLRGRSALVYALSFRTSVV